MPDADRRRIITALATFAAVAVPAAKVLMARGSDPTGYGDMGS